MLLLCVSRAADARSVSDSSVSCSTPELSLRYNRAYTVFYMIVSSDQRGAGRGALCCACKHLFYVFATNVIH